MSKVSDARRWVRKLDDEADDAEPLVDEEEKESLLIPIGHNRGDEYPNTGDDVDWYSEKLDLRSRVLSERIDDRAEIRMSGICTALRYVFTVTYGKKRPIE